MTALQPQGLRRADYLEKPGTLAVVEATASETALETAPAEESCAFRPRCGDGRGDGL